MALLHAWLPAFLLAVVSELAVAVPLLAPSGASLARRIATVSLAQLATHPSVWFIWPLLGWSRPGYVLAAEAFALVTEALVYRLVFERLAWSRAFAASALANGVSLLLGLWLL
jgi:hypothetical protein